MRVSIAHEQDSYIPKSLGMIAKLMGPKPIQTWNVLTTIDLSEEERAVLAKYALWDKKLFNHRYEAEHFNAMTSMDKKYIGHITDVDYTIKDVFKKTPFTMVFYTPIHAQNFAHRMENEILPLLKQFVTDTQAAGASSTNKTFEL